MRGKTPILVQEIPVLELFYPFEWERNFVLSWQTDFCKHTIKEAMTLCAIYVIVVFGGRLLMTKYQAFELKIPLAMWNLALAIFSFIGSIRTVPFLLNTIYRRGVKHSVCAPAIPHFGSGPVGFWVMLFIFSKVPELVDTIFIVLRKKSLIFLHWYHHITVLLFCWHAYGTKSASGLYFVSMNYSVHAVMYFYYFLSAIDYRPRWARLVTILQLSQMFVGVAVCGLQVFYLQKNIQCDIDVENLKWAIIMYSSYFMLFFKFFIDRYFAKVQPKDIKKKQI